MVHDLLNETPKAKLNVIAIWLPMLPGDAREEWKPELLDDPRVVHFWDPRANVAGAWFREHVQHLQRDKAPGTDLMQGAFGNNRAAWDVYFLYGPDAKWDERPEQTVSWGRPVFRTEKEFRSRLTSLLNSD